MKCFAVLVALLLLSVSSQRGEAADFTGYYPSLVYGSFRSESGNTPMNLVGCINFKSSDFTLSEAQAQFTRLTSLSALISNYGSLNWITPADLAGIDGEFAVAYVQSRYEGLGFDTFLIINVSKVNRSELGGMNERLDLYVMNKAGVPQYAASLEFPMTYLNAEE